MNRSVIARRSALVLLALGAALACDGPGVTRALAPGSASATRDSDKGARGNGRRIAGAAPQLAGCGAHTIATGSGVFGPSGGTLVVGGSELIIPPGALHESVTISGIARGDTTAAVDFYPQGLQFEKPATLALRSDGCALPDPAQTGAASIVYLDDNGTVLEVIPAVVDADKHQVIAPIAHFSGYAIAF